MSDDEKERIESEIEDLEADIRAANQDRESWKEAIEKYRNRIRDNEAAIEDYRQRRLDAFIVLSDKERRVKYLRESLSKS